MARASRTTKLLGVGVAVPLNSGRSEFSQHPYYQALFAANPSRQLLVDPASGRIVDANAAAARFYGYSQEQLQQRHLDELVVSSAGESWLTERLSALADWDSLHLPQRLASGLVSRIAVQARAIDLDGQPFWLITLTDEPEVTPEPTSVSHPEAVAHLLRSVGHRLRQSTSLTEVLQGAVTEVQRVLQADRVLVYRLDATNPHSGTIIAEACQPPLTSLLGWKISDDSLSGVLAVESTQAIADITQSNLSPASVELLQTFLVRSRLAVPLFQGEQIWGVLIAHQCQWQRQWQSWEIDLLESLELQLGIALALDKLSVLKNDFLSTVSHELRTPLSGIKTSAELLEVTLRQLAERGMSEVAYQKAMRYLEILQLQCDREIELVTDVLTLQQLEAGTQPFISSQVQLQYWVPQVLDSFEDRLQKRQQTLDSTISSCLPAITTDLFMFNRILGELLTNACKFTPTGGQITVSIDLTASREGIPVITKPSFQLRVINTGIEIDPAEQAKIFQPFYRIPTQDPWKHGGTGVGLALVKKLVAVLGGRIWVEAAIGATCFVVELPLESQPEGFLAS